MIFYLVFLTPFCMFFLSYRYSSNGSANGRAIYTGAFILLLLLLYDQFSQLRGFMHYEKYQNLIS
jgi:hypothetical protein